MAVRLLTHLLGVVALLQLYRGGWSLFWNGLLERGFVTASYFHSSTAKVADLLPESLLQLEIGLALQWIVVGGSVLYTLFVLYTVYQLFFGRVTITYNMLDRDVGHRVTSGRTKRDVANMARKLRQRGDVPPIYPNSWYEVMRSEELPIGGVKAVSMIGQQLAVFRGESGQVSVMDAYCPHLGAHLGVGGIVRGDCIECPFHGWQYNGETGQCVKVPYASKVPNFVKVKVWPSMEYNGIILVWYDAEGRDPKYTPDEIPEINSGRWKYCGHTVHYVNCHIEVACIVMIASMCVEDSLYLLRTYWRMGRIFLTSLVCTRLEWRQAQAWISTVPSGLGSSSHTTGM